MIARSEGQRAEGGKVARKVRWPPLGPGRTRVGDKPATASNTVRRNVIPQPAVTLAVLDGGVGIPFVGRRSREFGTEYLVNCGLIGAVEGHRPLHEV